MIKVKDIAEKYGDYEVDENKLKELLVEPKPKNVEDLQVGDKYFYFGQSGIIYEGIWRNNAFDLDKLSIGNVFLTYNS